MATKKKADPLLKLSKETLVRRLLLADARRAAEREQHLAEELDLQKIADNSLHREKHLGAQIEVLAKVLLVEFGGPTCDDESACEMAARLLREQRDKIAKLEAERVDISREEANELRDVLRTLTPSGTALLTSARDLVAKYLAKLEAERQPRMYRTIPSDLPYNRSEPITNADSATKYTREVGR